MVGWLGGWMSEGFKCGCVVGWLGRSLGCWLDGLVG